MSTWFKGGFIVVVVLALLGGGYVLKNRQQPQGFSVVYLQTGELYVGKLTLFPRMKLDTAYAVRVSDPAKNTFQLNPISEMVWAPQMLYLNREKVVFWGPLDENSSAAKGFKQKGVK